MIDSQHYSLSAIWSRQWHDFSTDPIVVRELLPPRTWEESWPVPIPAPTDEFNQIFRIENSEPVFVPAAPVILINDEEDYKCQHDKDDSDVLLISKEEFAQCTSQNEAPSGKRMCTQPMEKNTSYVAKGSTKAAADKVTEVKETVYECCVCYSGET